MSAIKYLQVHQVIADIESCLIIDVRSEGEFHKAHLPGAINIPILKDEERKIVGTTYKQKGRVEAVRVGLSLVGPHFADVYDSLRATIGSTDKKIVFYCWRGGLRSHIASTIMAWGGFPIHVLQGGYKSYRNWVHETIAQERKWFVLGGKTGSGKTQILHELKKIGMQIVDLEGLANHKGSTLGGIGFPPQPSTEGFENLLAWELKDFDHLLPVVVENESKRIGACVLPQTLWNQIQGANVIDIQTDTESRITRLYQEYAHLPLDELKEQTGKIRKRLGGQNEQAAQVALDSGDFVEWIKILLVYYDKTYSHSQQSEEQKMIPFEWRWKGELQNIADEELLLALRNFITNGLKE